MPGQLVTTFTYYSKQLVLFVFSFSAKYIQQVISLLDIKLYCKKNGEHIGNLFRHANYRVCTEVSIQQTTRNH